MKVKFRRRVIIGATVSVKTKAQQLEKKTTTNFKKLLAMK